MRSSARAAAPARSACAGCRGRAPRPGRRGGRPSDPSRPRARRRSRSPPSVPAARAARPPAAARTPRAAPEGGPRPAMRSRTARSPAELPRRSQSSNPVSAWPAPLEHLRDSLHVVEPVLPERLLAQLVLEDLSSLARVHAEGAHARVGPPPQLDPRLLRDGHRQHVATVVVGVLADQVHPPRGLSLDLRGMSKQILEGRGHVAPFGLFVGDAQ